MTKNTTSSSSFRPIVGIDLGTTNSAAAYIHQQEPVMIEMDNHATMLPSVVLHDPNKGVIVGEDARSALVAMPDHTKSAIKRDMGQDTHVTLGDHAYKPEEISAMILKHIKEHVDNQLGEGEKEAVITVPAYFTNRQRQATKAAGELAGFFVERIINEPTAASLAYGAQNMKDNSHILVYDLGGGTFDVSVVELMDGILEVKSSAGNHQLGGEDFDWALVDWFAEIIINAHQIDPREDVRAKARLKEEAENAKKQLSYKKTVDISIPVATVHDDQPIGLDTTLTREKFVSLIEPFLDETRDKLEHVLDEADLTQNDIDDVILVGGSTRIPHVQNFTADFFNKNPNTDVNPDEAVALGAAVQAGIKSGTLGNNDLIITDVAPFSMGIAVAGENENGLVPGQYHAIINKNTTIPVTRTQTYTTSTDYQTAINVEIYQGEHDWVADNYFLNEFLLQGLPAEPAGHEAVDITFRYNINGMLEVTARHAKSGNEMTVTTEDGIDRTSTDAYENSLTNIEAAYGQASDQQSGPLNWSEINVTDAKSDAPDDLPKEASIWKDRFQAALDSGSDQADALQHMIKQLESAIQSNEPVALNEAIENAIDLAIDLEL